VTARARNQTPRLPAVLLGAAVILFSAPSSALGASHATKPTTTPASVAPKFEPVRLRDWARAIGFEATWIEPQKKLRLQGRFNEIIFEADRREIAFNGVRVFLGEPPKFARGTLEISPLDRDRLLLPVLAPRQLEARPPVRTIVLDAGHGGKDQGTRNEELKLLEKDLSLDVVGRLKTRLEARGFKVVLTRRDDTFVDLVDRPKVAATAGADLFLSIHFNAGPAPVNGIETYALTPQYQRSTASDEAKEEDNTAVPGNRLDPWNALLGYSMHRQLQANLGGFDRGLKRARFVVIRDLAACPGILIECGYLSNQAEAKLISGAAYRDKLAAAIVAGVDAYNAALARPSTPAAASVPSSPAPAQIGATRAPPTAPR
jgi:N-acetylmuramoyl-L-alanine amidase